MDGVAPARRTRGRGAWRLSAAVASMCRPFNGDVGRRSPSPRSARARAGVAAAGRVWTSTSEPAHQLDGGPLGAPGDDHTRGFLAAAEMVRLRGSAVARWRACTSAHRVVGAPQRRIADGQTALPRPFPPAAGRLPARLVLRLKQRSSAGPRPGLPSTAAKEGRGRRPRHRCCATVFRWRYFQRYRWKCRQRIRPFSIMRPPAGRVRCARASTLTPPSCLV